jgi:hypothetical protein
MRHREMPGAGISCSYIALSVERSVAFRSGQVLPFLPLASAGHGTRTARTCTVGQSSFSSTGARGSDGFRELENAETSRPADKMVLPLPAPALLHLANFQAWKM